jgi:hypothetical protein
MTMTCTTVSSKTGTTPALAHDTSRRGSPQGSSVGVHIKGYITLVVQYTARKPRLLAAHLGLVSVDRTDPGNRTCTWLARPRPTAQPRGHPCNGHWPRVGYKERTPTYDQHHPGQQVFCALTIFHWHHWQSRSHRPTVPPSVPTPTIPRATCAPAWVLASPHQFHGAPAATLAISSPFCRIRSHTPIRRALCLIWPGSTVTRSMCSWGIGDRLINCQAGYCVHT